MLFIQLSNLKYLKFKHYYIIIIMWLEHIKNILSETNIDYLNADLPLAVFMIKLLYSRINFDKITNFITFNDYVESSHSIELRYFIQYTIKVEIDQECLNKEKQIDDEIKKLDEMFHTIYSNKQKIPTEDLPWASVMMPVTAGANSGIGVSPHFLLEGTWVVGFFRDPAKQEPVIIGALPGKNTSEITNFTIAASSKVGGYSGSSTASAPPVAPASLGGFKDPNSKYPTELYIDKADTNLLAQESIDTHPSKEIKDTLDSWSTASGSAEQIASTQASAMYPTNHVFETESGHYVEFDDTAGNERIHLYHKMGTFIEIDSSGNVVIKTVGNVTNITAGNMDTYVKGNYSISAGGNIDVYAGGNLTEKVDGNRLTTITGTETLEITGAVKNTFKAALTEEVTLDVKQDYKANLTTTITALGSIKATGAMTVGGSSISFN